jgi:hypothetical protein
LSSGCGWPARGPAVLAWPRKDKARAHSSG